MIDVVFSGRKVIFTNDHHNVRLRRVERVYREIAAALHERLDERLEVRETRVMSAQGKALNAARIEGQTAFLCDDRMRAVRPDDHAGTHLPHLSIRLADGENG